MAIVARISAAWRAFRQPSNANLSRAFHKAAEFGRLSRDWIFSPVSADKALRYDMVRMRERVRQLERDNSSVKGYLKTCATNIAGPNGIRLQALVRNNDGRLAENINEKIEDAWKAWATEADETFGRKHCTTDGTMNLTQLQQHLVRVERLDGETFLRLVRGFDNEWGFALQVIDADQVDERYNEQLPNGNRVVMGVEMDKWRRRVAYHLLTSESMEGWNRGDRERVPAQEIIHLFDPSRANQTRGVPSLSAAVNDIRHLDGYVEAELVAARTGAAKMGFYKTIPELYEIKGNEVKTLQVDANPGTIQELPPGVDFVPWSPDHPSAAFVPFIKGIMRRVASGLGITYVKFANDLEGVNYSSIRQGELDTRDEWRVMQNGFAAAVLDRVFIAWLQMAQLSGNLVLDQREPKRFRKIKWVPRGWQWVDPLKDVQAAVMAIDNNLSTHTAEAADRGDDFDEILETRAEERDRATEMGIDLSPVAATRPPKIGPAVPGASDPNPDENADPAQADAQAADSQPTAPRIAKRPAADPTRVTIQIPDINITLPPPAAPRANETPIAATVQRDESGNLTGLRLVKEN